jgi:hypothetical protein
MIDPESNTQSGEKIEIYRDSGRITTFSDFSNLNMSQLSRQNRKRQERQSFRQAC